MARPPRPSRETLPETVTFRVHPPPGYEDQPIEQVRAHFRRLLDARIEEIYEERRQAGLTEFVGMDAVLRQSPFASSGSTRPTRALDPRLACRQKRPRIHLIAGLQRWRQDYRRCYLAWRDGDRSVVFPAGSYGLSRYHGANVAEPQRGPPYVTA